MEEERESLIREGIVKFFIEDKGYGFITYDNVDYFVHISNVYNRELLSKGEYVLFEPISVDRGPKAMNVQRKVTDNANEEESEEDYEEFEEESAQQSLE